jgi:hypothetical protein
MAENNRNTSITVGTDSTVLSDQKNEQTKRIAFTLINTSTAAQIVSIAFTDEAGAGKGIVLSPGGFHSESQDAGFTPTQMRISAISSAAGATIAVSERIITGG